MPANYPNSQPALKTTFADNSPRTEELISKGLNQPNLEINAVAGELGTNPKDAPEANPAATAASVKVLLGQFKKAIRLITGETNWYDGVAATLQSLFDKFNAAAGHSHTGAADDGPQIDSNGLADDSVITARIEDGAVTEPKIGTSAVTTAKIADGDVTQEKIDTDLKYFREGEYDFIASGGVWTADSAGASLNGSMTALVAYINGKRVAVSAVTARAFTASKDTYVDLGIDGVLDYNEVANNAASPALATDHLRLAIVTTDGTDINNANNINQGQVAPLSPTVSSIVLSITDSLGNLIYNRNPNPGLIGYRQITANQGSITTVIDVTGLNVVVLVPANRHIRIYQEAHMQSTDATGEVSISITDGSNNTLQQCVVGVDEASVSQKAQSSLILKPSAGSNTYKVRATMSTGTGTIIASGTTPVYLAVFLE